MFTEQPKINCELLTLTYGVFVAKLIREADDHSAEEVNQQLEKVGYITVSTMAVKERLP